MSIRPLHFPRVDKDPEGNVIYGKQYYCADNEYFWFCRDERGWRIQYGKHPREWNLSTRYYFSRGGLHHARFRTLAQATQAAATYLDTFMEEHGV